MFAIRGLRYLCLIRVLRLRGVYFLTHQLVGLSISYFRILRWDRTVQDKPVSQLCQRCPFLSVLEEDSKYKVLGSSEACAETHFGCILTCFEGCRTLNRYDRALMLELLDAIIHNFRAYHHITMCASRDSPPFSNNIGLR